MKSLARLGFACTIVTSGRKHTQALGIADIPATDELPRAVLMHFKNVGKKIGDFLHLPEESSEKKEARKVKERTHFKGDKRLFGLSRNRMQRGAPGSIKPPRTIGSPEIVYSDVTGPVSGSGVQVSTNAFGAVGSMTARLPVNKAPGTTQPVEALQKSLDQAKVPNSGPSSRTLASIEKKNRKVVRDIAEPLHPVDGLQRPPDVVSATNDRTECRSALSSRFYPVQGRDALLDALLDLPPDPSEPDQPFLHALRLAESLSYVSNDDPLFALEVLKEVLKDTDNEIWLEPSSDPAAAAALPSYSAAEVRVGAEALKRAMAETATGMNALAHIEGLRTQCSGDQLEGYQHALQICEWLSKQPGGLPTAGVGGGKSVGSMEDFLAAARVAPKVADDIGGDDDHPLQLAQKALLYAHSKARGVVFAEGVLASPLTPAFQAESDSVQTHKGAYIAWKNNFTESGKGKDFNLMLASINKAHKYYQRAVAHGELTFKELRKDIGRIMLQAIGLRKDPYSGLGHGPYGADTPRVPEATANFKAGLRTAMDQVIAKLRDEVELLDGKARTPAQTQQLTAIFVRLAALELWRDAGIDHFRPDLGALHTKFNELAPHLHLDDETLKQQLPDKWYGKLAKLKLNRLEKWARDACGVSGKDDVRGMPLFAIRERGQRIDVNYGTGAPLNKKMTDAARDQLAYYDLMASIRKVAEIGNGGFPLIQDSNALFRATYDIPALFNLKQKRQRLDGDVIRSTMLRATGGDDVLLSEAGGNLGVNMGGVSFSPADVVGLGIAPIANLGLRNLASVKLGDGAAGSQYENTETKGLYATGGAKIGYFKSFLKNTFSVGGGGAAYLAYQKAISKSGIILANQDKNLEGVKTSKEYGADVINFIIDEVADRPKPLSLPELWCKAAAKFGDTEQVSFGRRVGEAEYHQEKAEAMFGIRAKANGSSFGPSLTAGGSVTRGSERRKDTHGYAQVEFSKRYTLYSLSAKAGILATIPMGKNPDVTVNTGATPLEFEAQTALNSNEAKIQLMIEGGQVSSDLSVYDMTFSSAKEHIKYVKQSKEHYDMWAENAVYDTQDGRTLTGPDALEEYFRVITALAPHGVNEFSTRMRLSAQAAKQLTLLRDTANDLKRRARGPNGRQLDPVLAMELRRTESMIEQILEDKKSWRVKWLKVVSTTGVTSELGVNFLLTAKSETKLVGRVTEYRAFYAKPATEARYPPLNMDHFVPAAVKLTSKPSTDPSTYQPFSPISMASTLPVATPAFSLSTDSPDLEKKPSNTEKELPPLPTDSSSSSTISKKASTVFFSNSGNSQKSSSSSSSIKTEAEAKPSTSFFFGKMSHLKDKWPLHKGSSSSEPGKAPSFSLFGKAVGQTSKSPPPKKPGVVSTLKNHKAPIPLTQGMPKALDTLGIGVVGVSGANNDCLFRSLLRYTGDVGNLLDPAALRRELLSENPGLVDEKGQPEFRPGNQLLGSGPAFEAVINKIAEKTGVHLMVHFVGTQLGQLVIDSSNVVPPAEGSTHTRRTCAVLYTGTGRSGHYEALRIKA